MRAASFVLYLGLAGTVATAGTITLSTDIDLPAPNPDPNQIITVFIHSHAPILFMNLLIRVNGDAVIAGVMNETTCAPYGWDANSIVTCTVNPDNSIELFGLNWNENEASTVGYLQFRCNSGFVAVYLDAEQTTACGWSEDFTCSTEPISVGTPELPPVVVDENPLPVFLQSPTSTITSLTREPTSNEKDWSIPEPVEASIMACYMMAMEMDSEPKVYIIDSDITENTVWNANDVYYIVGDPNDNYTVNVESLLVIEPGTIVVMGYAAGLHVSDGGTLIAKGKPDMPVVFTPDWIFFEYPDYVGYYWQAYEQNGPSYHCPIYLEGTASANSTIQYCLIEGAVGGVVADNIRLNEPIENNYFNGNTWGIYQFGPLVSDVRNNLFYYQDYAATEIDLCPDPNGFADLSNLIAIEQNTCDGSGYTHVGITIHGVVDPNTSGIPTIQLTNNILTGNYSFGFNLVNGAMYATVISTGYYANTYNKNWEFSEYNPVVTETNPYHPYFLDYPWQNHYLLEHSDFVDAGLQYIEQSDLIGTKTNVDNIPDKDAIDLGYHHTMWDYIGGEGIAGTDFDALIEMSDYWLQYSPFEPISPGYIDPNLYIIDPNHPELWIDPNTVSFGGDWNGDFCVDLSDLAEMAKMWNAAPAVPALQAVIEGNPSEGQVALSVSGCNADTVLVYAYVDGKNIGQVRFLDDDIPQSFDVSTSGNLPQEVKFMAIDRLGHFSFSETSEITSTSPLSYCILPQSYEPNEPIPFAVFNTGGDDTTVGLYGNGEQLLWSQTFTGNAVSGSIPADYTGQNDIVDYINFSSAGGASLNKTTFPKVPWGDVDLAVQALMVMPDTRLFDFDPYVRLRVLQAFINRGIKVKRLEGVEATWENVARYGQYGFVKYIYLLLIFEKLNKRTYSCR